MDKGLDRYLNEQSEKVKEHSAGLTIPTGRFIQEPCTSKQITSYDGEICNQENMGAHLCTSFNRSIAKVELKKAIVGHGTSHVCSEKDDEKIEFNKQNVDHAASKFTKISCSDSSDKQAKSTDGKIEKVIDDVWSKIDANTYKDISNQKSDNIPGLKKKRWEVIRLFISSTFTDFHAEREILVKKVIPELREWCEQYQLHLVECDLRWGIPKNTDTEETISICLDELKRCVEETNGQPFFLNMLGERYGWIPTMEYLSPGFISKYDWIYPTSMTHTEIIHGALRNNSKNSLFMIRDMKSLDDIPNKYTRFFFDGFSLPKKCMQRLKRELYTRYPEQTFNYKTKVSGTENNSGIEKVGFTDLDYFVTTVTDFFKQRITEFASSNKTEKLSETDQQHSMQDVFIANRGQLLIGREYEVDVMMSFVRNQEEEKCLLIIADPGTGKSSLVANHVLKLNEENIPCLYNFSGSAPGSTTSSSVLRRFCDELSVRLKIHPLSKENAGDYDTLKEYFREQLKDLSNKIPGFTVVLDAVNQFNDEHGTSCDWLPVPSDEINVRYIISCTPTCSKFESLSKKFETFSKEIILSGFNIDCREKLVETLMEKYNKKLDGEQMVILTSMESASSPLWLALACEELRVFGVFEQVTEKIKNLPDTIEELIALILKRLIEEDDTGAVKKLLCFISCSDSGLTETELRGLLHNDNMELLPMLIWVRVRRQVKAFLINTGLTIGVEMLNFFHPAVSEVVSKKYLQDKDSVISYNKQMALYYLKNGQNNYRDSNYILKHLQAAEMNDKMVEYFQKDKRSISISTIAKSLALMKVRCPSHIIRGNNPFKSQVRICSSCSTNFKKISQHPMMTKQLCIVCGSISPLRKPEQLAFVCKNHKAFTAPKTDKCYLCQKVLFLEQKSRIPMYVNCYTCNICSVDKCIKLLTNS